MEFVNNEFYDELTPEDWYRSDHPIALLRAEAGLKNTWVSQVLNEFCGSSRHPNEVQVLDVGCGAGFLSNYLGSLGCTVTGLDRSPNAIATARLGRGGSSVSYVVGDAHSLSFDDETFEIVAAMDVLEHVPDWRKVVKEAARVLKPGGLFLFHTFNRTFKSKVVVEVGMNLLFPKGPPRLHLHQYFIRPAELEVMCFQNSLVVEQLKGIAPRVSPQQLWSFVRTRRVPETLSFRFTPSLAMGYLGLARKTNPADQLVSLPSAGES